MTDHEQALTLEALQRREKQLHRLHDELLERREKVARVQQKIERRLTRLQERSHKKAIRAQCLDEHIQDVQQQIDATQAALQQFHEESTAHERIAAEVIAQVRAEGRDMQRVAYEQMEGEVRQELQSAMQHVYQIKEIAEACATIASNRALYAEMRLEMECPSRYLVHAYEIDEAWVERTEDFAQQVIQATQIVDDLVSYLSEQHLLTALDSADYRVQQIQEIAEVVQQVDHIRDLVHAADKAEIMNSVDASHVQTAALKAVQHVYAALRNKQTLMLSFWPASIPREGFLAATEYHLVQSDEIQIDHEV